MQVAGGYPKASLAFPPLRAFGSEGLKASLRQTEIPPFGGIRHRGPWPPDLTNISWPPSIRLISAAMGPNSFPAEFAGLGSEGVLPPGRFSPDRIPPGAIPKARNNSGEVVPGEILKRPHRDQMILAPVNSPSSWNGIPRSSLYDGERLKIARTPESLHTGPGDAAHFSRTGSSVEPGSEVPPRRTKNGKVLFLPKVSEYFGELEHFSRRELPPPNVGFRFFYCTKPLSGKFPQKARKVEENSYPRGDTPEGISIYYTNRRAVRFFGRRGGVPV